MLLAEAADWLEENREHLVKEVSHKINHIIKSYRSGRMPLNESIKTMDTTLGYIISFLRDKAISPNLENELKKAELIKFEEGIASRRVVYEIRLSELLRAIKIFRDEIWSLFARKLKDRHIPSAEFLKLEKRVNSFINYMMIRLSDAYISNLGEVIESQEVALARWEEVVKSASSIELKIPCRNEFAAIVRMQAEAIARRVHYEEEEVQDIKTAVGEACDNAIEHGRSERGIDIHYHVTGDELIIEVIDYGRGFDPIGKGEEPPDLFSERGRGIFLMKALMERVEIYSKPGEGTLTIIAKKRIFI